MFTTLLLVSLSGMPAQCPDLYEDEDLIRTQWPGADEPFRLPSNRDWRWRDRRRYLIDLDVETIIRRRVYPIPPMPAPFGGPRFGEDWAGPRPRPMPYAGNGNGGYSNGNGHGHGYSNGNGGYRNGNGNGNGNGCGPGGCYRPPQVRAQEYRTPYYGNGNGGGRMP